MKKQVLLALMLLFASAGYVEVGTAIERPDASTSQVGENTAFVFAYFNTGDAGQAQGLQYAYSKDGLKWEKIEPRDGAFLRPEVGGKLFRDPSIVQGPDGTYHMVWTTDWWKHGIGLAHSKDLLNWTEQKYLDVMADYPDAVNCWAPEISYDPTTKEFYIYWASTIPGKFPNTEGKSETFDAPVVNGVKAAHRMYVTTTKDFVDFTPSKLYFDDGYNCIDAFVVQDTVRDRFVMAIKNEDLNPTPKKDIRLSFSKTATGPWSKSTAPISPDWVEGPALLQIGDWWYLYYDAYTRNRYEGLKTKDFENWVSITDQLVVPEGMRHGTALAVPQHILDKMLKQAK